MGFPDIVLAERDSVFTWFDFVLVPNIFNDHINQLKNGKNIKPNAFDLLKMFIKPINLTNFDDRNNERCKKLRNLCREVIIELSIPFSSIDKYIPKENHRILFQSIKESSSLISNICLHRWIIYCYLSNIGIELLDVNCEYSIHDALNYLKESLTKSDSLSKQILCEINYDIGEFYFIQEQFGNAIIYFRDSTTLLSGMKEEEQSKLSININKLESFVLACDSFKENMMTDDHISLSNKFEHAKLNKQPDDIIKLLLVNITDKYLADQNASLTYRLTLSNSFQLPHSKFISICNSIYVVIHQIHDEFQSFHLILDIKDSLYSNFLFTTCENILKHIEFNENNPPKCFFRLRKWLRTLCYSQNSISCWNSFLKYAPSFVINPDDNKTYLCLQNVQNIQIPISQISLPLKRKREIDSENMDENTIRSKATYYYSMGKYELAEKYYILMGKEGYIHSLICKLKQNEKEEIPKLTSNLTEHVQSHNILPDLNQFEYILGTMLNYKEYDNLMKICQCIDSVRSEIQKTKQDVSLQSIGTTCDFTMNYCNFCKTIENMESLPLLAKSALTVISHFWKPYFAQKINLKVNEGLLKYITSQNTIEQLLTSIVALIYVNNKMNQTNESKQLFNPQENYKDFTNYEIGFTECWNISDQRFSSKVSTEGLYILSSVARVLSCSLLEYQPHNPIFLLRNADLLFDNGNYKESLCLYLHSGSIQSSFFCDIKSDFMFSKNTIHRMITCLHELQALSQVIVLSQMVSMGDYATIYKLVQSKSQTLNTKYFKFIWHVQLLELLISVFIKTKEHKKAKKLIQQMKKPAINDNNPAHIKNKVKSNLISSFFKELLRDFTE